LGALASTEIDMDEIGLLRAAQRMGAGLADPTANDDQRLQQQLLVAGSLMFILAGTLWGLAYMILGEPAAGLIPLFYAVVSALTIAHYRATRRYRFFRFSQLLLILLLPVALQVALGGFVGSSAVVLWSLISPFGALLFDEPGRAPRWFVGFMAVVVGAAIIEPRLDITNNLPPPVIVVFYVANVGAVSLIAFLLLYSFVRQRNLTLGLLRTEQEKSENLLLNILPREIAAILKNENRTIADHIEGASILFADMVGFTPMTASMTPIEMVELLNSVFSHFDELVETYGVEKIRTIGDSYMVAAGVPRPRPDHAQVMAAMALDMQAYVHTNPWCVKRQIDFRIGINSGPLVAGVIGRKKFTYDLWGDAVNTASRMESHGEPGRIQITAATYELIRADFICESRGKVNVKGKGEMETWYLLGARSRAASDPSAPSGK